MIRVPLNMWLLLLLLLPHLVSVELLHKPHSVPCSHLIVFGDDFSDDGVEFGEHSHGFLRNSNGQVWSEYINKLLGCEEYINYAHSGAKSSYDNVFFSDWSGILWQIEYHLMSHPTTNPDSLIILQVGGSSEMIWRQKDTGESVDIRKIHENIVHAVQALVDNVDDGMIIIMNMVDPCEAPGHALLTSNKDYEMDISSMVSEINSKLWKLALTEGRINQRVRLFDLNAAVVDAIRGLNTAEPFTYQQANLTSRKIFNHAYHNQWFPATFIHYKIARKLIRFLEDL